MAEKKTYVVEITCFNCFEDTKVVVPFGVTVKNHLATSRASCSNCGCRLDSMGQSTTKLKI
jgi:transcription elongation factor Elf1